MKFYVLRYDFNNKRVEDFNIFNSSRFNDGVRDLVDKFEGAYEAFIEELDKLCKYCFWSKREYELSVGDLFETNLNKYEKIDVYRQLEKNIPVLAYYLIANLNVRII